MSGVRDVYALQISIEVTLGKKPCPTESITISFTDEDMEVATNHHDDDLVITEINDFDVKMILIESNSSIDMLFLYALLVMGKTMRYLK